MIDNKLYFWFRVCLISGLSLIYSISFSQTDSCINNIRLGISFPPMSQIEYMEFSELHLNILNVDMIRSAEDWSLREATQGEYNWGPIDARADWVETNDYSWMLTIQSNGPDWACNPDLQNDLSCAFSDSVAFRTYIDNLLIRHGDVIDKIQFGNEWHSDYWYIGSAKDFIRANNTVWESVQENADHIEVVLGGFASGTMTSLAACDRYINTAVLPESDEVYDYDDIQAFCNDPETISILHKQDSILAYCNYDIIDMHLYDDVELWPLYYHIMDSIINGEYPIIISEMGGPNLANELPYSDEFQAERLYQYISCIDTLGVTEVYFFKLIDGGTAATYHQESGLIDNSTLLEKPAYYVFKSMNKPCPAYIEDVAIENQVVVFPNPAESFINIYINSDYNSVLEIIDLNGKVILIDKISTQKKINTEQLNPGRYFVKVITNNQVHIKKLIIE